MNRIKIKRLTFFLLAGWAIAVFFLLIFRLYNSKQYLEVQKEIIATIAYQKDIAYRMWISQQGGVYVKVSEKMRPSPYLNIENRDIVIENDDTLTLVNPGYFTRQVLELSAQKYNLQGKLISLKPINPINLPDEWEREALELFEKGDTVASKNIKINDKTYKRFVKPFVTEQSCLTCHAKQGYKVGDIRGGISILVPTMGLNKAMLKQNISLIIIYMIIFALGFIVIYFLMYKLNKQIGIRQESERDLLKKQEYIECQNQELQRLNTDKNKFFKILAHDLKNPFYVILGFTDLLLENHKKYSPEKIEKQIQVLNQTAHSTYKFLEDLLVWSNSHSGKIPYKPEKIVLHTFLEEQKENVINLANRKNIGIVLLNSDEIVAYADYNMLKTIVRNLITNAIKFTHKNGVIKITSTIENNKVLIAISDNGIGIEAEIIQKLWDISERTETLGTEGESGTGLGLSICKEFVERHGGTIWVESEIMKGSEFKFTLPLYQGET